MVTACYFYHILIFMSYRIRPPKCKLQYMLVWNYKGICLETMLHDTAILKSSCMNNMVHILNSVLHNLFGQHGPVRHVKAKNVPAPWLTPAIMVAMAGRDRARRTLKHSPSVRNLKVYKILRKFCSRMCRAAKRRYFHNSLDNQNSSDVWKVLDTVGIGKSSVVSRNDTEMCVLNRHFSHPPVTFEPQVRSVTLNKLSDMPMPQCSSFEYSLVSKDKVKTIYMCYFFHCS